ncbi:hypothetical protein OAV88_03935 [bacterium]|nr:hypothetical protein [bacterium]
MQRVARGRAGRKRVSRRENEKRLENERLVFEYYAGEIQRLWRGHFSRKYKHDFYARKQYIATVVMRGNELREKLEAYASDCLSNREKERARKREEEFQKVTENLHHLVSTKSTPGIYNNPYFENKKPKVRGALVEDHLRDAFKKRGKKKIMKKKYTEPQVVDRRSIRISTTYDEDVQSRRWEKRLDKLKRISKKDFIVTGKGRKLPYIEPLNTGEAYIDPYLRFQSTKQIQERNKSARMSDKPFYTNVSSKKPMGMTT